MKVAVVDMLGKKIKEVELSPIIFESPINVDLIHQAYVRQMANSRLGTHDTLSRGEVSGGGKKPWRQKGTGRARQGSIRAPQWKGGGKVHTPHPRDYSQKMPLKMRRAALRSALSARANESAIVIVDEFKLSDHKSQNMQHAMKGLIGDFSALLLMPNKEGKDHVILASRNNPMVKVLLADYLNVRDLLNYDRLVMELPSLKLIEKTLGKLDETS